MKFSSLGLWVCLGFFIFGDVIPNGRLCSIVLTESFCRRLHSRSESNDSSLKALIVDDAGFSVFKIFSCKSVPAMAPKKTEEKQTEQKQT